MKLAFITPQQVYHINEHNVNEIMEEVAPFNDQFYKKGNTIYFTSRHLAKNKTILKIVSHQRQPNRAAPVFTVEYRFWRAKKIWTERVSMRKLLQCNPNLLIDYLNSKTQPSEVFEEAFTPTSPEIHSSFNN
jgi:hypothetical protein